MVVGVRFLLGPAGSGKTWRCLAGIRDALRADPDGAPLLFLAPKQATFQLERQLLADPDCPGFARLQILSFERLAFWIIDRLGLPEPRLLDDVGRTMVLRGVLENEATRLRHVGRAARTPGFAHELSRWLGQLLQLGNDPARLESAAARPDIPPVLGAKLGDFALVQRGYSAWLAREGLADQDQLLDIARHALAHSPRSAPLFEKVWMDGFAEMTPLETALLAEVAARSGESTLAFCVDPEASATPGTFWSVVSDCFRRCHAAVAAATDAPPCVEPLPRLPGVGRFAASPRLASLESNWARGASVSDTAAADDAVEVVSCPDAHAEAECAAAAVRRHVAAGGRYRDVAVLTRTLDTYGPVVERTFRRLGIPCFLDQRFPIRHHPLVELTRSAVRIAINPTGDEDWFAWLKCGLLGLPEWAAERTENALLRKRWKDHRWATVAGAVDPDLHDRVVGPIERFRKRVDGSVDAKCLAAALRSLWQELDLQRVLAEWDQDHPDMFSHRTVLRETEAWLDELVRGFGMWSQPLRSWMPILETAWSTMTAGAIPPALDQVLVGTIDRSRNPDLRLVILPGWADDVFPAPPPNEGLLSRAEMERLAGAGLNLGPGILERVGHERFYAYIALTRTRERVVVCIPNRSPAGRSVLPSPYVRSLPAARAWEGTGITRANHAEDAPPLETLDPPLALALCGSTLKSSASGLEQAATCPLQHGLARLLGVRERSELEYDARREGTLQHQLLAEFHRRVRRTGRRWRDVNTAEALAILGSIAGEMLQEAPTTTDFEWDITLRSVRRFLMAWLQFAPQWPLDPTHAELKFGKDSPIPPLRFSLPRGSLSIEGTIDRVDLHTGDDDSGGDLCAIDYKLSGERFSPDKLREGRQLQLPVYLLAAMSLPGGPYRPIGMVYASLSPDQPRLKRRDEPAQHHSTGAQYPHRGRIDANWAMANRGNDWEESPFSIRFRKDGTPDGRSDALTPDSLASLLDDARATFLRLADDILLGQWNPAPAMDGAVTVCGYCPLRSACRYPGK